jgi:ATP-binding cassette subfamily B protein
MNSEPQKITRLFLRLWRHISLRRRAEFGVLFILMLLASFAEILSIGSVLPFLGVLTAPEQVFDHWATQPIIQIFDVTEPQQLVMPFAAAFGVAALVAGTLRLVLLWASTRLSFATGADLSIDIYRRTLYQNYSVHCSRNSSELITGIATKANTVIYLTIVPTLTLFSSSVMLIVILFTLLSVDPLIALVSFGGFGLIYSVIIGLTRKQLQVDSQRIAFESSQVIKSLQEGLGGIRDVLIDGTQDTYCQIYSNSDLPLRRSQGNNLFIGQSPRYAVEAMGMVFIAGLAYSLAQQNDGIIKAIPTLGILALGAQRLIPVVQQAYASWSQINSGQASLQDALELLDQPIPEYANYSDVQVLPFHHSICLKNLEFQYSPQTPKVIKQLSLVIPKGSRVGFIGSTGSGKSTLLDIVMGLLEPTSGALEVDGQTIVPANQRAWQSHIAHVPQTIFLADSTVEENIAFGVPKDRIDRSRVKLAARQAQISETIESWPSKYQTFVGERGIRLSGGQCQRIGIARALYKQADVIIFDEATSALDSKTELAVMQAIEGLSKDLTLLIIAHRLTTLKNCTQIVELGGGSIKQVGTYEDVVKVQSNLNP